jgi:hypothetical protein
MKNADRFRLIMTKNIIQTIQHNENSISAIEKFQDSGMDYSFKLFITQLLKSLRILVG